jgi:hypothetical protein
LSLIQLVEGLNTAKNVEDSNISSLPDSSGWEFDLLLPSDWVYHCPWSWFSSFLSWTGKVCNLQMAHWET